MTSHRHRNDVISTLCFSALNNFASILHMQIALTDKHLTLGSIKFIKRETILKGKETAMKRKADISKLFHVRVIFFPGLHSSSIWGLPRCFGGTREHYLFSGNQVTLANILREQRIETNLGEQETWKFWKSLFGNKGTGPIIFREQGNMDARPVRAYLTVHFSSFRLHKLGYPLYQLFNPANETYLIRCSLEALTRAIGKQCRPRSECGICSGSPLFANTSTIFL